MDGPNSAVVLAPPQGQMVVQVAWRDVTLQHVLDMAAGLSYVEDYADRDGVYYAYARATGYYWNDEELATAVGSGVVFGVQGGSRLQLGPGVRPGDRLVLNISSQIAPGQAVAVSEPSIAAGKGLTSRR